jgi:hypothetical protein
MAPISRAGYSTMRFTWREVAREELGDLLRFFQPTAT